MRSVATIGALLFGISACTSPPPNRPASACVRVVSFGVPLTGEQKELFLNALASTPLTAFESDLPHKLAPIGRFDPYFSIYPIASTAYALVLESPRDMHRWRALAKLDSFDSGEYGFGYESARREALARNPRLFDYCPQFHVWSEQFNRSRK